MSGCWVCGKPVAGAVCVGPHPRINMSRAVRYHHIEGVAGTFMAVPCKYCGLVFTLTGMPRHLTTHERASREQAGINRAIRATLAAIREMEAAA